jgi:hypothetical protein
LGFDRILRELKYLANPLRSEIRILFANGFAASFPYIYIYTWLIERNLEKINQHIPTTINGGPQKYFHARRRQDSRVTLLDA